MSSVEWRPASSFSAGCPVGVAYKACIRALAGMPSIDVGNIDENALSIEASVKRTLWSPGEELRILVRQGDDAETLVEVSRDAANQSKDRRNYDDLECAVRCQISRLTI
jgi:hypothetical protein